MYNDQLDKLNAQNSDMNIKQSLKKVLFAIARSPASSYFSGFAFQNLSDIIPINKIIRDDKVVVFEHPSHFWKEHYLLVPKRNIRRFIDIDFDSSNISEAILQIFIVAQRLVVDNHIGKMSGNFGLLVNGGAYQDIPQVHFHLAAGKAKEGEGFVSNDYSPKTGKIIIQNDICTISENANPERERDYIVIPNISLVSSFSEVNFNQSAWIIIETLKTIQELLTKLELPAFTIMVVGQDIANIGKFNLRIVSGKRIG